MRRRMLGKGGGGAERISVLSETGIGWIDQYSYFIGRIEFSEIANGGDFTILQYSRQDRATRLVGIIQNEVVSSTNSSILTRNNNISQNLTEYSADASSAFIGLWIEVVSGTLNIYTVNDVGGISSNLGNSLAAINTPTYNQFMNGISSKVNPDSSELISIQYYEGTFDSTYRTETLENAYLLDTSTDDFLFYAKTDGETDNGAYPPRLTSTTAPSPYTLIFSEEFNSTSVAAWRCFNDNMNDRGAIRNTAGTTSSDAWIGFDCGVGNSEVIDGVGISNYLTNGINSFTVQGSNDGSAYIDIHTNTCTNNDNYNGFSFANSTAYRYWRIYVNSGHIAGNAQIRQIWFFNSNKEWTSGGGYARVDSVTFPS